MWCAKSETELTPAERSAFHARITASRKLANETRAKARAEAAIKAKEVWEKSEPLTSHPYLAAKKIKACGARLIQGKIIVPGSNFDGQITTYQSIQADGTKRFLTDGEIKGSFFSIPGNDTVGIAEGFATAASIHEAMGWTMLVAFNAGNLVTMAQDFRQRYPQAKLMICGDDDIREPGSTKPNTGRVAAERAAALTGGKLLMPELDGKKADWNDVAVAKGIEEVQRQIKASTIKRKGPNIADIHLGTFTGKEAPPQQWLVEDTLPRDECVVLAAIGF